MTSRYAKGLGLAFVVLGAGLGAVVVPSTLPAGRSPGIIGLVDVWLGFGLPTVALLAVGVGPIVLALRRSRDGALTVGRAAAIGAAAGPLLFFGPWLIFRETPCDRGRAVRGGETVVGLLQFWWRLPAEFIVGALPPTAASAFFASWLAGRDTRSGAVSRSA